MMGNMIGLNTEGSNEGLREEGSRVMFVFMKESILLFILTYASRKEMFGAKGWVCWSFKNAFPNYT